MFGDERADARMLDELEAVLRSVGEELSLWRARAQRAEAELREGGGSAGSGRAAPARPDPEMRNRLVELEADNKGLRQRVDAARVRMHELLGRLGFLEEQAREVGNGRGAGGAR